MNLQKGHSCVATVALSVPNCGSFANSKSSNLKNGGVFRWLKVGFPLWLENFRGPFFVKLVLTRVDSHLS